MALTEQLPSIHDTFLFMTMSYETNWKKHIDPDLDSAIRTFLFYVRYMIKETESGFFAVNDEVLQTILKDNGWQSSYDGNEWLRFVQEVTKMQDELILGVSIDHNIKGRTKRSSDESLKNLLILTTEFSEKSKARHLWDGHLWDVVALKLWIII